MRRLRDFMGFVGSGACVAGWCAPDMRSDQRNRREVIALLGGAATWPLTARAQQQRAIPRIGLVSIGADPANPVIFRPFLQQFRELGYVEGQNVIYEKRFAAGEAELISGFIADLVERNVDAIVTTGQREADAARKATGSIPIVTIVHPDPIGMGLAQSLAGRAAT
jgi:putative ABC transport system substrate-binding protein